MTKPTPHQIGLTEADDEGHTKMCPVCSKRFGNNPFKRGKARDVALTRCEDCEKSPLSIFERRYGVEV